MNEIKAEIVDCMIYDFVIAIFLYTFIRVCLILIFLIISVPLKWDELNN